MMAPQKFSLLWMLILCCVMMTSSDIKINVRIDSQCLLNQVINQTCIKEKGKSDFKMNVKLNISSQGNCKPYSFDIKEDNSEIRMNETVEDNNIWFSSDKCSCPPYTQTAQVPTVSGVLLSCHKEGASVQNMVTSTISACTSNDCSKDLVDPGEKCRNATYRKSACGKGGSKYILRFKDKQWKCVNCDRTAIGSTCQSDCIKPPEKNLTLNERNLTDKTGHIDSAKALAFLDNVVNLTRNINASSAAITMGDVIGVFQRQADNVDTEDLCFSSAQSKMNILDCLSDLNPDTPWSVMVPSEAFDKASAENNESAFVVILRFKNMGNPTENNTYTILNNEIYGIDMGAEISNLNDNIEMLYSHKDLVSYVPSCSSWDGKGNVSWTTSGCETEMIDNTTIKCSCSHLTFFAVLMFPIPEGNTTVVEDLETLTLISSIGCGISMFFLSIALFMHFLLRKAKSNQATKILMNTFVALFLLNLSFLSNESVANSGGETACVFIALLMHYSMLATFTWFFIQALHMYLWLIRKNVTITNYIRKITIFGWVFASPAVIAVVSIRGYSAITLTSSTGKISRMCWITDPLIIYIVNIGFYILVFIFTSGIFITILTRIVQARHIRATDGKRITFRKLLMMVMSLFLLFGLTWAVAFFSYGPLRTPSFYVFCVLNGLQGFFLFLYYMYIHNDVGGHFSDDPKSSGSITSIISSNTNAVQNVYAN